MRPADAGGAYDARVVDATGRVYVTVEGYRTIESPGLLESEWVDPLRAALE